MSMQTPNLMDVPTQATRRIERYGLLALILFLTTFGVLYVWDGPSGEEASTDTVLAASEGSLSGFHPRSTARPTRPRVEEQASTQRAPMPPRASADPEQRELAMKQRARSAAARAEAERAAGAARTLGSEDRDKMVGHFRGAREAQPEVYDSPAQDVSVSGYSGRRVREEERAPVTPSASAPVEMEYLVKSGDCLSTIAQDKLGSVRHLSRLLEVNGLTESSTLRIGQRLILPHIGEREPVRGASLKPVRAVPVASDDWAVVTVQEGDSLWKIAARVLNDGNRYKELMAWNSLTSETLQPGAKLRVQRSEAEALAMGEVSR